jgi:hypothetical protein
MSSVFINLVLGFKKEIALGTVILTALAGIYLLGLQNGYVPHEELCSHEIIQLRQKTEEFKECSVTLTACKARKKGECTITCSDDCDVRIKSALDEAKQFHCED